MVETCFSHSKILEQAKVSVVVSFEHFKFNIQVVGVFFGPWKKCKNVLKVSKVHLSGTL